MRTGGTGGTKTKTGLVFEQKSDFRKLLLKIAGYKIIPIKDQAGVGIFYKNKLVARSFQKNEFYKYLQENKIDWKKHITKRLLPDDALLIIIRETLFIIEVKFQQVDGSVDEKLQTCDFKRKQYAKLVKGLKLKVEYVYVLSDWFKDPRYQDVLDYIESMNCHYRFNSLPLEWLGLPTA